MAAAFPPEYMAAVMFGNGLSGFGTVCLRAVTILIWPASDDDENEFRSALALYFFAFIVLAGCSLAQVCIRKNKYAMFHLQQTSYTAVEIESDNEASARLNDTPSILTADSHNKSSTDSDKKQQQSLASYIKQAKINF